MGANMQMLEMQAFNPLQAAEMRAFNPIGSFERPCYEPPYKYFGIAEQRWEPVENIWDKQARLEHDYFKSSRREVLDDLARGILPQTGAALNALNSFNDSRDYPEHSTPRYGRSSGLSRTGEFEAPIIRHDPELLSPKPLLDRFEPEFSAPRMRHGRYDEDGFNAPKIDPLRGYFTGYKKRELFGEEDNF